MSVAIQVWSGAGNKSTYTELYSGHWCSVAVQIVSEPENCHGVEFKLRADAGVWVQQPLQICLAGRSKSKKCDKQLTHIVRVSRRHFYFFKFFNKTTNQKLVLHHTSEEDSIHLSILSIKAFILTLSISFSSGSTEYSDKYHYYPTKSGISQFYTTKAWYSISIFLFIKITSP